MSADPPHPPTRPPPQAARPGRRPGVWTARYDLAALRPPDPPPPGTAWPPDPVGHALRHWCLEGSGPGTRPLWQPQAPAAVALRFAVAVLEGGDAASRTRLAQALALERDGSLQLQACRGAVGRGLLRVQTKLHDALWWRARRPEDAWDSGWLRDTPEGLRALAAFQPRRATLLLAAGLTAPTLQAVVDDLQARQGGFGHAVRLLVVGAAPRAVAATGRYTLGAAV